MRALILAGLAILPAAAQTITLAELERRALERNPAIGQAKAAVRAAAGRAKQAGLYPNPVLFAVGEEIAGGPIIRGGEIGGGFEQRVVTAGKLGLDRKTAQQEERVFEAAAAGEKLRLLTTVRSLYYQALGEQRLIEVRTELAALARRAVETSRELANVGQADRPDVLAMEIEAERIELDLVMARHARERTWRQLAAAVNDSGLQPAPLAGELEKPPQIEMTKALEAIFEGSPELHAASANVSRAEFAEKRARVEKIPDVVFAGGVRNNRELLNPGESPVGTEGFFTIGASIPIFNRNQGGVAAARAELERARLGENRARLSLRNRLAAVYKEYQDAMAAAVRYKSSMIPKASEAYQLYSNNVRQMAAAYPQALITQRNLFQLQDDYIKVLVVAWQRAVEIQGLLTEDMP
ncbi:MAG TPA: TolC family protein [Rariglobus sp.]